MAVSPASSAADTSFFKSSVIFSSVEFSTAPSCTGAPSVVLSATGDSFTGSSVGVSFTGSAVGVSFAGSSVGVSFVSAAGEESYPPTETSVSPSGSGQ